MVANASPPRVGKSRVKSNSASVAQVSVTAEIEMPPKVAKRGPPPAWATRKPAHAGKTTHETRASAKNDNSFEGNRLRTMRNNPSSTARGGPVARMNAGGVTDFLGSDDRVTGPWPPTIAQSKAHTCGSG